MVEGLFRNPQVLKKSGRGATTTWIVQGEVARDCDYIHLTAAAEGDEEYCPDATIRNLDFAAWAKTVSYFCS